MMTRDEGRALLRIAGVADVERALDAYDAAHGLAPASASLFDQVVAVPDVSAAIAEQPAQQTSELATEARARRTDPGTSQRAAASVADLRERQRAVLRVLADFPEGLTDEQIATEYERRSGRGGSTSYPQQSPSGLRTRRGELVVAGFAGPAPCEGCRGTGRRLNAAATVQVYCADCSGHDGIERRQMSTGRQAIVWRMTPKTRSEI